MVNCESCCVHFEYPLELHEHLASLSHHIRVESSRRTGEKRLCPICDYLADSLTQYSEHVATEDHIRKVKRVKDRILGLIDSMEGSSGSNHIWMNGRIDYNMMKYGYDIPLRSFPIRPTSHLSGNEYESNWNCGFVNDNFDDRINGQWKGYPSNEEFNRNSSNEHLSLEPSTSNDINRTPHRIDKKNKIKSPESEVKVISSKVKVIKKKKGVLAKILSTAMTKKKNKDITSTPKVTITGMDNKSKKYEKLARKTLPGYMKNKTHTMVMERQNKYALVDSVGGQIEEIDSNEQLIASSSSSVVLPLNNPSSSSYSCIIRPLPSLDLPSFPKTPNHIKYEEMDETFRGDSLSSTYAFCPPVHSTPHELHQSNWPQFVRGLADLSVKMETDQSNDTVFNNNGSSYENPIHDGLKIVKEEIIDDNEPSTPPSLLNQSDNRMNEITRELAELMKKKELKYINQKKKLDELAFRRIELKRRFDEEMKLLDEEEYKEKNILMKIELERECDRAKVGLLLQQ